MRLVEQLYKLQQVDLEIRTRQQELSEIASKLSDDNALVAAESRLASWKQQLHSTREKQMSVEWELEDLQEKVRQIESRLYGGKTKDTKELVNLEREVKGLKNQIRVKEDAILELMGQVEELEAEARATDEDCKRLRQQWEHKRETLGQRKREVEAALLELQKGRDKVVERIVPEMLNIYERLKLAKGQAVVKVERGKCQGCHITVPTSQWQKAKAGDLIQCNSCGRILYLE
ncbi:MAG: zinc ribbon domain-containing protein [Dehalococcoidia bacterium]